MLHAVELLAQIEAVELVDGCAEPTAHDGLRVAFECEAAFFAACHGEQHEAIAACPLAEGNGFAFVECVRVAVEAVAHHGHVSIYCVEAAADSLNIAHGCSLTSLPFSAGGAALHRHSP